MILKTFADVANNGTLEEGCSILGNQDQMTTIVQKVDSSNDDLVMTIISRNQSSNR